MTDVAVRGPGRWPTIAGAAVVVLVLVFGSLRFVNLDADFPPGITQSGALYTDEGWYAHNAIRRSTAGTWIVPGGFNAVVNLPIGPLLQATIFSVYEPGLVPARALVAVSSLVLLLAAFAYTRRHGSTAAAALVALLLSVNFFLFAYSRLATLDVLATAVATLALAVACVRSHRHATVAVGSGLLLAAAVLTKTTAMAVVPVLALACAARLPSGRRAWGLGTLAAGTCLLVVANYNVLAWLAYPDDYVSFHRAAEVRLAEGPLDLARNMAVAVFHAVTDEGTMSVVAFGLTALLAAGSRRFRENTLVRLSLVWVASFILMVSITAYQPSRYFVMLVVPTCTLFAVGVMHLRDVVTRPRVAALAALALVGAVLLLNAVRIAAYLRAPDYTLANAVHELSQLVDADLPDGTGVLIGDMAKTVALETGVSAMTWQFASGQLGPRIARQCPTHLVTLGGPDAPEFVELSRYYLFELIREWNVLENYLSGRPVALYRLHPNDPVTATCDQSARRHRGGKAARGRRHRRRT